MDDNFCRLHFKAVCIENDKSPKLTQGRLFYKKKDHDRGIKRPWELRVVSNIDLGRCQRYSAVLSFVCPPSPSLHCFTPLIMFRHIESWVIGSLWAWTTSVFLKHPTNGKVLSPMLSDGQGEGKRRKKGDWERRVADRQRRTVFLHCFIVLTSCAVSEVRVCVCGAVLYRNHACLLGKVIFLCHKNSLQGIDSEGWWETDARRCSTFIFEK